MTRVKGAAHKAASHPTITEQRWTELGFDRISLRMPARTIVALDALAAQSGEPRWRVLEQLIWERVVRS